MEKRIVSDRFSGKIPIRVILDMLKHYWFEHERDSSMNNSAHYGYFKNDSSRKTFLVFKTVRFDFLKNGGFLFGKFSLKQQIGPDILKKMIGVDFVHYKLVPIIFFEYLVKVETFMIRFETIGYLPNKNIGGKKWGKMTLIKHLELQQMDSLRNDTFNIFENLERLHLVSCGSFKKDEQITGDLNVWVKTPKLKEVGLWNMNSFGDSLFKRSSNLTSIKLSNCRAIFGIDWINMPHLIKFEGFRCEVLLDKAFIKFRNIRELVLNRTHNVSGLDWKFEHLEKCEIILCEKVRDEAFIVMPKLKSLKISLNSIITGKQWGVMNQLANLSITDCENFEILEIISKIPNIVEILYNLKEELILDDDKRQKQVLEMKTVNFWKKLNLKSLKNVVVNRKQIISRKNNG